jgi:hypothetical protein
MDRLRWACHIQRIDSNEMSKTMVENTAMGARKIRRPRSRSMDDVLEDIRRVKITNWWLVARSKPGGRSREALT